MKCNVCPRQCNIDRSANKGFCGAGESIVIAKSALHYFEEPIISGNKGSGAVFFAGCNMRCEFCQNSTISRDIVGKSVDENELVDIFFTLQQKGAHNINLVTPTHFLDKIIPALRVFKKHSNLPIIYNSGGYESVESIKKLDGLVDVFLPDFKYSDDGLATTLSKAKNYTQTAINAILEMTRLQPINVIENGLIKKGVIVRHLVLPSYIQNSLGVVEIIKERFPNVLLSLMSQYTPCFYKGDDKNLKRKVTTYEYNKVLKRVEQLSLDGFCQSRSSATKRYTPDF